jgi:glycosyltransferase involved in cell wall biosynthesis
MNICFVTKYPPIEGGVSMRCYWLARGLAERGHTIVVVTNAPEVEAEYRLHLTEDDRAWYAPSFPGSGGAVIVKATAPLSDRQHYIPFANPYVTKLATIAQRAIAEHDCSRIFAYYLEPYGVAAHLASYWTDTPYVFRHAGSDLGRLMKDPDLHGAYREVFRRARYVSSNLREPLIAMGVEPERIWHSHGFGIPDLFTPQATPLDLAAAAAEAGAPFDPSRPTIGIYGKVGVNKGSLDLLHALSALKKKGMTFNLVAVTQGRALERFVSLARELGVEDFTCVLPFMAHWRIPGFLRACTAVCFLERHFPVSIHAPTVPREVLACGTCLIVSREIVAKQAFARDVREGENLFGVDPTHHDELAARLETVIRDPQRAAAVGEAGHALFRAAGGGGWVETLDDWERHLAERCDRGTRKPRESARPEERADALASCLPLTRAALSSRWPDLVQRYCGPNRSLTADYQDAINCAEFLASLELDGAPPWIADLLRYERAHNRIFALPDVEEPPPQRRRVDVAAPHPEPSDPRFLALVPRTCRGVQIEAFAYDMTELCSALHKSDTTAPIDRRQTILLFKPEPNFVGQELVINAATKRLVEACDGTQTVQAIAAAFVDGSSEASAVTRAVVRMIKQLTTKGIVSCEEVH